MNIDELQPGPELDKRIEEDFFHRVPCDKWEQWSSYDASGGGIFQKGECGHDRCYPADNPTDYSTRIIATCAVVEKMIAMRDWPSITYQTGLHLDSKDTAGWHVVFRHSKTYASSFELPHAICLAVLKAVDSP